MIKTLAETDWFASETSPRFFIVYANKNENIGIANAPAARQLIDRLTDI